MHNFRQHSLLNRSINLMSSSFILKFSCNTSHRLPNAMHTPSRTLSNCSSKLHCTFPSRLEVKASFSLTTTQARHSHSTFHSFCGLFNDCSLKNLHGVCTNSNKYCTNSIPSRRKTFNDEFNFWKEEFERNEVDEPELSAKHIMNHVKKVDLQNSSDSLVLTNGEKEKIATLMTCRLQRMPVQYIIGEWDFHSITLDMRPPVFIPRPETETLVNETLKLLQKQEEGHVLELCCGSGAISLALLHNIPSLRCVAVDQSGSAITLTAHNAKKIQLDDRLTVCHSKIDTKSQWRDSLPPNQLYDVIVSNPPYIPSVLVPTLQSEILIYEDLRALDGGKDGMELIKTIIQQSHHLLKKNGHLLLEVDPSHATLLPKWLKTVADEIPLQISRIIKDLNGKNRFIHLLKVES